MTWQAQLYGEILKFLVLRGYVKMQRRELTESNLLTAPEIKIFVARSSIFITFLLYFEHFEYRTHMTDYSFHVITSFN